MSFRTRRYATKHTVQVGKSRVVVGFRRSFAVSGDDIRHKADTHDPMQRLLFHEAVRHPTLASRYQVVNCRYSLRTLKLLCDNTFKSGLPAIPAHSGSSHTSMSSNQIDNDVKPGSVCPPQRCDRTKFARVSDRIGRQCQPPRPKRSGVQEGSGSRIWRHARNWGRASPAHLRIPPGILGLIRRTEFSTAFAELLAANLLKSAEFATRFA